MKSSLSKFRKKISYEFFKEKLNDLLHIANPYRRTYRGFYIYATDGLESVIPLSQQLLSAGFKGKAREKNTETYYPRMYFTQVFDVVNELSIGVVASAEQNENRGALELIDKLETNSIVLYDRAYICKALIEAHIEKQSFFIFRCPKGGTFREIIQFFYYNKDKDEWDYKGHKIRLLRVRNPKTNEDLVLATNLDHDHFMDTEIAELYTRRWSIETAFRDSVAQGFEQWHSRDKNGILQELYAHLWMMNLARIQIMMESSDTSCVDWLERKYKKPNLKLLIILLVESIPKILNKKFNEVLENINILIKKTLENRQHFKRSYERVRKYSMKSFPYKNLVSRRSKST